MSTFASSQPRFTQFVFPDSKAGHQTSNSSSSFAITTNKLNRPRTSHSQVTPAPRASKLNQSSNQSLSQSTSHPINQSANFANKQTIASPPMDEREQALRRSVASMERPITSSSRPPPPAVFKTCHYTELQEAYQWDQYRKSMDPHHLAEEPSRAEHARHYDVYDYTMNQAIKDNTAYIEEMKNKREEVEIFLKKMRARRGDTQVPITRREHRELKEREIAMNQRTQSSEDAASMSRPASPYTSTSWAASPATSPARTRATSPAAHVDMRAVNQPSIPAVQQPIEQPDPSISTTLPANVANQPAAHPVASVDPSAGKSNIARFWQEEIDRKRHQAFDARESRRRRHMGQLAVPDDPQEARALWERMKDEMWRHWEATQTPVNQSTNQSTSHQSVNESRAEPNLQSAEKPSPSGGLSKPLSPTKASFESIKPVAAPLPRRASSPMKRSTSAAVPNLGPNQHRPATPLKARSGSYHAPITPQPARSSSATKPASSTNNIRPRTPAAPILTPLSMSPPPAATAAPPVSPYSSYTIKQLMDSMDKLGLSAADCVEKIDMIERLERYQQQQYRQSQQERFERDCDQAMIDINSWVKQKPIQTLLNELNASFISVGTMLALTSTSSLQDVERVYRRTLLTIHPDKVPHDDSLHKFKATEVFKIIHSRFKDFKLQVEARHGQVFHDLSNQAHYFRQ